MSHPSFEETLAIAFEDELVKIAQTKLSGLTQAQKVIGLMAAGGVTYEALRRANQDRRMGRAMRAQQGAY